MKPLVQFPYQSVTSWGSTKDTFHFNLWTENQSDLIDIASSSNNLKSSTIVLNTLKQGKKIEDDIMNMVRKLMFEIEAKALSVIEFNSLLKLLFDESNQLRSNWKIIVNELTEIKKFTARQAVDLMNILEIRSSFEKFDVIIEIYPKLLHSESFQLVINSLEDEYDRQNLIYQLKTINKDNNISKYTDKCIMLNLPFNSACVPPADGFFVPTNYRGAFELNKKSWLSNWAYSALLDATNGLVPCPTDITGDGSTNTADFLDLLGSFGTSCD
jgi:hypothetical protein